MRIPSRALVAFAAISLPVVAAGCGSGSGPATASGSTRSVDVTMTDNAYQPTDFRVTKGETVRFRFKNNGTVNHEAIVGDDAVQMKHHEEMAASSGPVDHGNMSHGKASATSPSAITVAPGTTGELTRTFDQAGTLLIGCHVPGHWEAGMKATITIG
jgi:uncharacterized cupredoxin-like copper-binding protein